MPPHDLESARELAGAFEGRVASSHEAHAEFIGRPTVLVPADSRDVNRALKLAGAAGKRVFVRSGRRMSSTHVSFADGVVVSMESFARVEPEANETIRVGVAATVGELAAKLGRDQFLPLGDNRSRSVASALLTDGGTPFPRSAPGLPLRLGVASASAVTEADALDEAVLSLDAEGFSALHRGERSAVMTEVVLDASRWKEAAVGRWIIARVCRYEARSFGLLCDRLFSRADIAGEVDLSLRVTSAAFGMQLVVVRATGRGDSLHQTTREELERAIEGSGSQVVLSPEAEAGAGPAVRLWVATGPGEAREDEVFTRFGSTRARSFAGDFREAFCAAVDLAIGGDAEGREHAPGVGAWAELRLAAKGGVDARAHVAELEADSDAFLDVCRHFAAAMPAFDAMETARRTAPARAAFRGRELSGAGPIPGFRLLADSAGPPLIDGFKGEIERTGERYEELVEQYARSSYDADTVAERMTPGIIAVPLDVADVEAAVRHAAAQQPRLRVVARSGGHQYCGLSSGGAETLLLDLRNFSQLEETDFLYPANGDYPIEVTVRPGVRLETLSPALADRGVLIPHGECPLVNIGGHVQTGGVGHQLRSFGLALDYVLSFKMVTAVPGTTPTLYRERTFNRPTQAADDTIRDGDVFRAVLGGCPGSWGVLTEITFQLVPDSKTPNPYGRTAGWLYHRDGFTAAMESFRQWVERADPGAHRPLPEGVDLFLTVLSGDLGAVRPPVLLIEAMARDRRDEDEIDAVFDEVSAAQPFLLSFPLFRLRERESVAAIAHAGTRKRSAFRMRSSGREFNLPYRKSLYVTHVPFTRAFRDGFVQLVDEVYQASGVKVVFQAVVGRGVVAKLGEDTTHMQRRQALAQLVFDVFYEPGHEDDAIRFQARMRQLLPHYSAGKDTRMFWGTFEEEGEAQLDLDRPTIQELYFDDPTEIYPRLQAIKRYTDSDNLFQTSFTIQP